MTFTRTTLTYESYIEYSDRTVSLEGKFKNFGAVD
jgi:hypothetical protein